MNMDLIRYVCTRLNASTTLLVLSEDIGLSLRISGHGSIDVSSMTLEISE